MNKCIPLLLNLFFQHRPTFADLETSCHTFYCRQWSACQVGMLIPHSSLIILAIKWLSSIIVGIYAY